MRKLVKDYTASRPQGAHNFFCKEDGQPLDRNDVLNLLDICLLQTSYKKLKLTPHSFRQERALEETLAGCDFEALQHECRWSKQSRAFDAYACSDLVALPLKQVHDQYPKYRQVWTTARLRYLSQMVVETEGCPSHHPHTRVLRIDFLTAIEVLKPYLPDFYPHPLAIE